jgi:two-component system LytT family response regulator
MQINYDRLIRLIQDKEQSDRRLMIKIGQSIKVIHFKDVAYFHTMNKLNFVHLFSGRRYPVDLSLEKIEMLVPGIQFFRVNRQYIINLNAIHEMLTYSKSRVKISLGPGNEESTIVSAERAPDFRKWLSGEKT